MVIQYNETWGCHTPHVSSCPIYDMTILIEKEKCSYDEE